MAKVKVLDCTLRDGGYLNKWNFSKECVRDIYNAMCESKVQYCELGYINNIDLSLIEKKNTKIFLMADFQEGKRINIIKEYEPIIDGIRLCAHKPDIPNALGQIRHIKDMGYITSLQMMAITNYDENALNDVKRAIPDELDILSIADSNGSLFPQNVADIIKTFTNNSYLTGFHSHNNLQLSLANSIQAIDSGADIIDCTLSGIGRGAGNLPTELLLSYLNKLHHHKYKLHPLFNVNQRYILPMKEFYNWGYSIPQMLGGFESIHPFFARNIERNWEHGMANKLRKIGKKKPISYEGKQKILCVIPSRYKSTRFAGKPLVKLNGKEMIQIVYENAKQVNLFSDVIVATDSDIIEEFCKKKNINYMITSESCKTGTDRVSEVADEIQADLYVNVQGDEPLIMPSTIEKFVNGILNLGDINRYAFDAITTCDKRDKDNPNVPKVILDINKDMIYMTRNGVSDYKELGMHGYTKKALDLFKQFKIGDLELSEKLEFLRFLENGFRVRIIEVKLPFNNHAVDVPADVSVVEDILNKIR